MNESEKSVAVSDRGEAPRGGIENFPKMPRLDLILWRAWDWKIGLERTDDERRQDWAMVMLKRRTDG